MTGSILLNPKGLSVLFLLVAMLLMVTLGYVFSYLLPTKQKSVKFPIFSTQAFFIAQSGAEYAIRYSSDQGWRGTTDSGIYDLTHLNDAGVSQRSLGAGRFTVRYTQATNSVMATGEVTNSSEKRVVRVSNFTEFLRLNFITSPPYQPPYWSTPTRRARFYVTNVRIPDVRLTAFSATWTATNNRRISDIYMNGIQKYSGNYASGSPPVNFNRGGNSQTIAQNQVVDVLVYWNNDLSNGANIIITFYTGAGESYAFNLDPEGNGLP